VRMVICERERIRLGQVGGQPDFVDQAAARVVGVVNSAGVGVGAHDRLGISVVAGLGAVAERVYHGNGPAGAGKGGKGNVFVGVGLSGNEVGRHIREVGGGAGHQPLAGLVGIGVVGEKGAVAVGIVGGGYAAELVVVPRPGTIERLDDGYLAFVIVVVVRS